MRINNLNPSLKRSLPISLVVLSAPAMLWSQSPGDDRGAKAELAVVESKAPTATGEASPPAAAAPKEDSEAKARLEKQIAEQIRTAPLEKRRRAQIESMTQAAYRDNQQRPLWKKTATVAAIREELAKLLKQHGLTASELAFFSEAESGSEPNEVEEWSPISRQDLRLTLLVAEASLLLKQGPDSVPEWPHWRFGDDPEIGSTRAHWESLTSRFGEAITEGRAPLEVVRAFIPQNPIYQGLLKTKNREASPTQAPPQLTVTQLVKAGHRFEQAAELSRYLIAAGHLEEAANGAEEAKPDTEIGPDESQQEEAIPTPAIFTEELSAALKDYQRMNGLQADGILGPQTAARISNGNENRSELLRTNLHRARRFPDEPGSRYLHANIPSGEISGFVDGKETLRMRIVFGKDIAGQRTPIFRDEMETVVFRPYWNLPYGIAVGEQNYSDLGYLERNGFEIISHSGGALPLTVDSLHRVRSRSAYVRQGGGTNNALGIVKFLFPNKHAVYFHDTPYKHFFKNHYRAQSHGCVRLENPGEMAKWVLAGHDRWAPEKIDAALQGKRTEVALEAKIPVYITYFTAIPDAARKGRIGFYPDIYDYDRPDAEVDVPGPKPKPVEIRVPEPEPSEQTQSERRSRNFFFFRSTSGDKEGRPSPGRSPVRGNRR